MPKPRDPEFYNHYEMCVRCHQFRYCDPQQGGLMICRDCEAELPERVIDLSEARNPRGPLALLAGTPIHRPQQVQQRQPSPPYGVASGTNPLPYGERTGTWSQTRHLRFRLWHPSGGEIEKDAKTLFHGMMKLKHDPRDYPINPMYKKDDSWPCCSVCGGMVWGGPRGYPAALRALAKQLGLRIKIDQWKRGVLCQGWRQVYRGYPELEEKGLI